MCCCRCGCGKGGGNGGDGGCGEGVGVCVCGGFGEGVCGCCLEVSFGVLIFALVGEVVCWFGIRDELTRLNVLQDSTTPQGSHMGGQGRG